MPLVGWFNKIQTINHLTTHPIKQMRILTSVLAFLLSIHACNKETPPGNEQREYLTIQLEPETQYQAVHSFGASDAWSCQFIGKNWPVEKKKEMARLLFSTGLQSDESPEGIGLSSWRFNVGAGSAEQGHQSGIQDQWRRAECFLTADGSLSFEKQSGQQWFMQEAAQFGVQKFTIFANSPPVYLTKNNKAYSSGGKSANLDPDQYDDYANFLAAVAKYFENQLGIPISYISPFNEPQWDWKDGGQEGSPWENTEMAAFTRILNQSLVEFQSHSEIEIAEAGQIQYLYSTYNRPGRGNQIETFFNSSSPSYLGDLDHLAKKIAAHSYYTTWDLNHFIETRKQLAEKLSQYPDLEYSMSEYTLLEDNPQVKGPGRDLGIDPALYMARVIHTDLCLAGASTWEWWLAISPYNYKDGLIYTDLDTQNGGFYPSKMLWALGNYSRFIRPGMIRIGTNRDDQRTLDQSLEGILASSFMDPESGKTVSVILNMGDYPIPLKIKSENPTSEYKIYRTAGGRFNLTYMGTTNFDHPNSIPAKSITTFVEE
jgi:O-glycosyl hydrolase